MSERNGNGQSNRLTEAQRALLQKFPQLETDDPIVEMAAWNAALEQRLDQFGGSIDLWTTAILKQAEASNQQGQLFVSQSSTLQAISTNNAELSTLLQALKPTIEQLVQDSTTRSHSISRLDETLSSLSRNLEQIKASLAQLQQGEERLSQRIEASSAKQPLQWGMILLGFGLAFLVGLSGAAFWQVLQGQHQVGLMNSALIRLERMERAIGTQP